MKKRIISLIWSWDTASALACFVSISTLMPPTIELKLSLSIHGLAISVLSIIFSVFFASLAFIISASNDQFVKYLESKGLYEELLWIFKWSLISLFVALMISISVFFIHSYFETKNIKLIDTDLIAFTSSLFVYSTMSAALVTWDTIKYAQRRARFLNIDHRSD